MDTDILEQFGKHLKMLRKENGLTQEMLAEKAEVHPTYIGKLESGKNNPSLKLLYKISGILDIKLSVLFGFDK